MTTYAAINRAEPSADARWNKLTSLVKADTILCWYRELIARKHDGSSHRQRGWPTAATVLRRLVVRNLTPGVDGFLSASGS